MDALAVAEASIQDGYTGSAVQETEMLQKMQEGVTENKFQKAISAWKTINLSTLIGELDTLAGDILAHQKDALLERKEVAQRTKDFRKLDDAGKLSEYKTLLKAYQTFVDLLTTHGKESSSAFLQIYTTLSEAPDPFPLLEASVESLVISEDSLPKLTSENEQLRKQVNRLTTQLEQTEERLQSETQTRREAEESAASKAKEIENSWTKVLEEKEINWKTKQETLEEKVGNQERLLEELKANYEVSQRLGQTEQNSAREKATSAELQLLSSDFEKTSTKLAEMQARNEQLRMELARASSQKVNVSDDDPAIVRLQSENSGLLRKLETLRFERESERRELETTVKTAERRKITAQNEVDELQTRIRKWSDYDEIKRELTMLKSIELSGDVDDLEEDELPANGSATGRKESLEQLLLARNKKLSNDLTLLRVSHQELNEQLDEMREQLSSANNELEKSQKLCSTLESDLMKVQEEAANILPSSGMSVAGTYTSRYPQSSRRGRASPTSSIISGYDVGSRASTTLEALRSGEPVGGGSGILPMVQAQRDRFKQKNQQLEEELQKTYSTVTSLRQEVASLQKDNLNLYEKTRYVSAYSRGGASSSSYGQGPSHTSVYAGDDGSTEDRWKSQYEANISPFAAFRGREATRAYKRMSMPERMVFTLTRIVLSTRTSRNLFAGYCFALHALVFLMLYWMGNSDGASHHLGGAALTAAAAGNHARAGAGHVDDWRQEDLG